MENNSIIMVERAFQILDYIFEQNYHVGVSQIARDLSLPKANVFRILSTLLKQGAVEKDDEERYSLGRMFIKYGNMAKKDMELTRIAEPILSKLANEIGESVSLGIRYIDNALNILSFEGESSILVSKLIPISPLYCSAMGKIFLAHMPDAQLEEYFANLHVTASTKNTITSLKGFLDVRDHILSDNLAYDLEEYEYGLACISTPVFDGRNAASAAISISGPKSRLEYKGFDRLTSKVKEASQVLSEMMKYLDLKD